MLKDLLICLRGGLLKGLLPEGFRTCPEHGEPDMRLPALTDGRRTDDSVTVEVGGAMSIGESVKVSIKLGVDELAMVAATLPKRKGGSWLSALDGRWTILLVDQPLVRVRDGLVTGRFLLRAIIVSHRAHKGKAFAYRVHTLEAADMSEVALRWSRQERAGQATGLTLQESLLVSATEE